MGLHGRSGAVVLGMLLFTIAMIMLRNMDSADNDVPVIAGFALMAVAGVVVVVTPSDPLPLAATLFIVVAGPIATVASMGDHAADRFVWSTFAFSYVLSLLTVRGRLLWAWIGVASISIATVAVGFTGGMSAAGVAGAIAPIGTVAAVSVFAVRMRPTLESLRLLRKEATTRAAAEATIAAQSEERDRQLARLAEVARPLLERIVGGEELDAADRFECRLREAELRDGLRAPQLAGLAAAARGARGRGVEVQLLDDGGLEGVPAAVRSTVLFAAARELDAANAGSVTVRVLPKGRRNLATVLVSEPGEDRRTEVDGAGTVRTAAEATERG
ncbi:hypothetical protein FOY51_07780 [Antrihabitans cavernicola]|uniref:Histidine kinase n=2 Tax=Antrihabitans cavernicola TaxID=2495913 RepID=A0A5A7SE63_9NOCA|nr:hypothetical protein FOY51_07780 [Spelaeibacter cavernicola]